MDLSLTDEQQALLALSREFLDRQAFPPPPPCDPCVALDLSVLPITSLARVLSSPRNPQLFVLG